MMHLKLLTPTFLCLAINAFGTASISWQTAGIALNDNGDGMGPGTSIALTSALPEGSLWQLVYSEDGVANFNPANPTVPGGDDVVLNTYSSLGTTVANTGRIHGDGIVDSNVPINEEYGAPGEFVTGNVYTRIFNSATPGSDPTNDRYRDTGMLSAPGEGTPTPTLTFDVMDPALSSTQADLGFPAIEVNIPLPEPSTLAMFGLGVLMLVGFRRRD